ncbi:MAG: 50S ribosomal protein L1, partial [Bacteroidetes bacterium]|nr:50S ribosomal protein L1 [Bacteroidota bacterium]
MKHTKNRKTSISKIEKDKLYDLKEASQLIKEITFTKFDASVDMDIRLGVDPKKANQMVRGITTLPHGTGKTLKVLVLCNPEVVDAALEAGADFAGLDEYLEKIKGGWTDIDVIITSPEVMPKLGRYGKVLGPRGLMPNPKAGTVTNDIPKAVQEVKSGKIDFKVDKYGIIHTPIARASFEADQISENCAELIRVVNKLRPTSSKGTYFRGITIST